MGGLFEGPSPRDLFLGPIKVLGGIVLSCVTTVSTSEESNANSDDLCVVVCVYLSKVPDLIIKY